jgi:hypothetical protein
MLRKPERLARRRATAGGVSNESALIQQPNTIGRYRNALRWNRAGTERWYARPMAILLTPPALEVVLQGLHDSEIRCGIQNEPPAGGITAWIDYGSRTEKATFYGTIVGDQQVRPAADRIAAWMHETALRLFPDSPYAKEHSTEA